MDLDTGAGQPGAVGSMLTPTVLAPLAARYGRPTTTTTDTTTTTNTTVDEDRGAVRAMPLILRMERDDPPPRSALLEASASAAVGLCLDERSQPGGPWYPDVAPWVTGRIRKVARRARGAHWVAVTDLPGVTVHRAGAQVRALLPWLVDQTPRAVTRLQVGGTDLPADDPGPPPDGVPVLWLSPHAAVTTGKAAAQVGHGSMLLAAWLYADGRTAELARWAAAGCCCAVRTVSGPQWERLLAAGQRPRPGRTWRVQDVRNVLLVRDAGYTEIAPGTVTVAATWAL